ncbi:DSBA domain-containing protein [Nitrospira tepida]|uniref:DSBA domain-containing protein n=1 Tax=Nitrospira tepida TaxID=2973512 RepID=A0AA86MXU7_9BACT|nr:DsbA family protein [Nitrospira tepida]CAI4031002.1 DSBA domain-containing protein [Nitrospira tepida]
MARQEYIVATLYSDPNCPFCYAIGERLLTLGVERQVEWRGVQHAPHLPIPRDERNARLNAAIGREVLLVGQLAPEVPIRILSGKPNTGPAIRAIAAALHIDPALGHVFKRRLYRSLWQSDADISDERVLATCARGLGLSGLTIRPEINALVAQWQQDWEEVGVNSVPMLVRRDGEVLSGLAATEQLAGFLGLHQIRKTETVVS